jgi:hypothetical protein
MLLQFPKRSVVGEVSGLVVSIRLMLPVPWQAADISVRLKSFMIAEPAETVNLIRESNVWFELRVQPPLKSNVSPGSVGVMMIPPVPGLVAPPDAVPI